MRIRKKTNPKCTWLKDLRNYFSGGDGFINKAYRTGPLLNGLCYCPLMLRGTVGDADKGDDDNLSGKISKATPKCEMVFLYKIMIQQSDLSVL